MIRGEALRLVLGGKELLAGVDIAVARGEVFGVLGPNGAGKTSLLKVLAGDVSARSGTVWLNGTDVTNLPLWRRARCGLGYVPQSPSVLLDLTVSENIRTFEAAARVDRRTAGERAALFALESKLDVCARDLSGGERRRLELLRAMVGEPRVLLCDEPFAAGDPGHIRLFAKRLRDMAAAGKTVVIADHRVADTLAICDRAMLLLDGSVELVTEASAFRDHPAVRGRYLG